LARRFDRSGLITAIRTPVGFSGVLLRPGDAGYDDARRVHNGMIDKRPAAIVRCRSADDVRAAVALGREHELELSIRGGGHNVAGTAVTDGGLMIDLAEMHSVEVDPIARRARVEGGVTWGELDRATQAHGLAVTGGMISSTGIAGLTLGGGLGWLMGRYGLSTDNLLAADVVTADGRLLTASEHEYPDLFWAMRGGGGNFGVVCRLGFQLHPVGRVVTAVRAAYPLAAAGDVLALYRELTTDGPDDLTMNAALLHAPDGSATPLVGIVGCHIGSGSEAERDLEPLRGLAAPVLFEIEPCEYTVVNSLLDGNYPRGALNYWKSRFLRALSEDAIASMVARFETAPSPMTSFVIENLHGAVVRVPVDATAVPLREPGYNFLITSVWLDPAATDENVAWTRAAFADLEPFTAQRRYSNYLAADEMGDDPVRAAFGPNYDRLVEVKNAYDPENVFRLNQNIKPTRA
jgi:FAD/FMN-containing dehydrogenase